MESTQKKIYKFVCPLCGKTEMMEICSIVDANKTPKLREQILSGEFFRRKCPDCGRMMKIRRRVLYYDCTRQFFIYLLPGFTGEALYDADIEQQYPEFAGKTKRIVPDINRLKEKILLLEAGIDDRAVELTKLALAGIIRKKYQKPIRSVYLTKFDEVSRMIGFSFRLVGEQDSVTYQTKLDVYELCCEVAQSAVAQPQSPGFLSIGPDWAKQTLTRYHEGEK